MSDIAAALDLVLPRRCVGCGISGSTWCAGCRPFGALVRVECGLDATVAVAAYDGVVRAALLRYKERGRRDLGPPLAELLARAVAEVLAGAAEPHAGLRLVPVPSSRRAAAARGGDHVLRLARRAGRHCRIPVSPVLRLARPVADSAGLTAVERTANLAHAFAARPPGAVGVAVLVDDIVTTGATLREAAGALRAAGWTVAGAAVVAATPPGTRRTRSRSSIGSAQLGGLACRVPDRSGADGF